MDDSRISTQSSMGSREYGREEFLNQNTYPNIRNGLEPNPVMRGYAHGSNIPSNSNFYPQSQNPTTVQSLWSHFSMGYPWLFPNKIQIHMNQSQPQLFYGSLPIRIELTQPNDSNNRELINKIDEMMSRMEGYFRRIEQFQAAIIQDIKIRSFPRQ